MGRENHPYQWPQGVKTNYIRTKQFKVSDLDSNEREVLFQTYGLQLDEVEELTAAQACFFAKEEFVSPDFSLQSLYKLQGVIDPEVFTAAVERLVVKTPVLRSNFCFTGKRWVRVILRERPLSVVFHVLDARGRDLDKVLENIQEADRRRSFDLVKDRLLRLAVFRTGLKEYALLFTQPQLVADSWDVRQLFERFFSAEDLLRVTLPPPRDFSFAEYLALQAQKNPLPARQYWRKLLQGLPPPPQIPGHVATAEPFLPAVAHFRIGGEVAEGLRKFAQGDAAYLAAILHAAWGLVLLEANAAKDTYFCLRLSSRSARLENVGDTATLLNVFPVRVHAEDSWSIRAFVETQFRQVVVSQPLSYCRKADYQAFAGRQEPLFQHFLSFHGFLSGTRRYSETHAVPGVVPVSVTSFDAQDMALGMYFRQDGSSIMAEFVYHAKAFSKQAVDLLMQRFLYTLNLMRTSPGETVGWIKQHLQEKISWEPVKKKTGSEAAIETALQKIELFSGIADEDWKILVKAADLRTYAVSSFILRAGQLPTEVLFVVQGTALRSQNAGGWMHPLDTAKEGEILDVFAFLPERRGILTAEAGTDPTVVLALPLPLVQRILRTNPQAWELLLRRQLLALEEWQKRALEK